MPIDVTSLHHRRAVERWERTSVPDLVERMTWSFPDKTALVGWDSAASSERFARVTYREANDYIDRFATALARQGFARGDIVVLWCENSVEAVLAKLAITKAGMVPAGLNPALAPDVVADILERIQPVWAVADAELWPRIEKTFAAAGVPCGVTIEIGGPAVPGSTSFADFVDRAEPVEPDVEIHGDDIWELLFTSGTTASPKAVMLSHSSAYLGAYGFALTLTRGLRLENELVLCCFFPLVYHITDTIFGLGALATGGTLVVGRRPEAGQIAAAVDAERATALWGGSPQLIRGVAARFEEDDGLDASSLTVIVYGWAALHPETLASLKRSCGDDLIVVEIFGQTESIACHRFWPAKWAELYEETAPQLNYVGVPSPLLASTVMDAEGGDLAGHPGEAGEAVYRSPVMLAGYYRDEAATREAFRHGWFHSGDSCAYDDQGLRIMVDRYKDIVKTGGENVSSIRVESVLVQHPAVERVAVIGLPHEHWGDAVTAVVVPAPGAAVDTAELVAFARERLAGFEAPKDVIVADDLPETVGGKVLKYRLRARFADHYESAD